MSVRAYVGLGSNLGPSREILQQAGRAIAGLDETALLRMSPVYLSSALGCDEPQPDYHNAVVEITTGLPANILLRELLVIEQGFGRVRPAPENSARSLDLDLLLYGDQVQSDAELQLPHPRIQERAFVLYPLCDLDEDIVIPGQGRAGDLLGRVSTQVIERL